MKELLGYSFAFVEDIKPVLDREGNIKEYFPQERYKNYRNLKLHKYGNGAFCRFSIDAKWSGISGVYAFYSDNNLIYIGQCLDFAKRFNLGYGNISPRNCYQGGQSTNCKLNKVVLETLKTGKIISIYFYKTGDFHKIESRLIKHFNPIYYNVQLKEMEMPSFRDKIPKKVNINNINNNIPRQQPKVYTATKNPQIIEVREYIISKLKNQHDYGCVDYIIVSGTIHKELNMNNAMPTVCSAMRTLGEEYPYEVLKEPPKGNGSKLIFRYIINKNISKINIPAKNPKISEVREHIIAKLKKQRESNYADCIIISGIIHKELNMNSAMPTVCSAMRTLGEEYPYEILKEPPKGNGSRLIFRYILNL